MDTANWIFLTPSQAVDAFACDFQQYGTQPELFARLVNRFPGLGCDFWFQDGRPVFRVMRRGGQPDLEIAGEKMGVFLIFLLESAPLTIEVLTTMAGMVFQTPAVCCDDQEAPGIWIEHGMARFSCIQCGRCCRDLAYAHGCTRGDVRGWQLAGRADILARVREVAEGGFEIWIDPKTHQFYDTCPWLSLSHDTGRCFCTIHEHKPEICRQYPLTAKHAAMTGCRGNFSTPLL